MIRIRFIKKHVTFLTSFVLLLIIFLVINDQVMNAIGNKSFYPENPIPTYAAPYFKMNNNIMFELNDTDLMILNNISDPYNPIHLADYSSSTVYSLKDFEIIGNLMILVGVRNYNLALEFVNTSELTSPELIDYYELVGVEYYHGRWEYDNLHFEDNYLYILGRNKTTDIIELKILNCTILTDVQEISSYSLADDGEINHYCLFNEIFFEDVLIINRLHGLLEYVNISDKHNPVKLGTYQLSEELSSNFEIINHYLFSEYDNQIKVYNINDLYNPVFINVLILQNESWTWINDLEIHNEYLFVVYTKGLEVFNLSNLIADTCISRYKTLDQGYIYFHDSFIDNNRIYMPCDSEFENRTIYIIDFSDITNLVHIYPDPNNPQTHQDWTPSIAYPKISIIIITFTTIISRIFIKKKK